MEWLTEPFALGFQQRALIGGAIAGVMCAVVGTWLVLRGMSVFGDAFVHGIVPGIALAVVLDFSPFLAQQPRHWRRLQGSISCTGRLR